MPEQKTELKTYRVDYACDSCGVGVMQLNGNASKVMDPIDKIHNKNWPHICSSCGEKKEFDKIYPQQIIE